jgi:Leucine-rich repeat (LRR) protein
VSFRLYTYEMYSYHYRDLSFNQIQDVSKKTLAGLFKLRSLDLSNNLIVEIQEDAFLSLDKLEIL